MTNQNQTESQKAQAKKAWRTLELKSINVASNTQAGASRIQNPEVFNFYRPS